LTKETESRSAPNPRVEEFNESIGPSISRGEDDSALLVQPQVHEVVPPHGYDDGELHTLVEQLQSSSLQP